MIISLLLKMFLKYISRIVLLISISPVHILNAREFEGNELELTLTKRLPV